MINWLRDLLSWLRQQLGGSVDRPSIKILEEYHSDGISVLRIEDGSIPGCSVLWRIDRHYEKSKFFVCVLNIAALREELAARKISLSNWASSGGRGLADNLAEQIQQQNDVLASHYWITGWSKEFHSTDRKGNAYYSSRLTDVRLLACDLAEIPFLPSDRYAKYFARTIIKRLAANDFREFHQHRTWQSAVKSIDWKEWLSGMAATHIDQYHVLQPKRSRNAL